jgi:hypothetical protein
MFAPVATVKEIISALPKFDEITREKNQIMGQQNFTGGKVDLQKPHSNNFATTHSLLLAPNSEPSSYDFGANFFDTKLLMMGGLTNMGDMNANVRYEFTKRLSMWFRSQMANMDEKKMSAVMPHIPFTKLGGAGMDYCRVDLDYKGSSFVSSLVFLREHHCLRQNQFGQWESLVSPIEDDDVITGLADESMKIYQCQYTHLHSITSDLSLGGSLTGIYQFLGTPAKKHENMPGHTDWMGSLGFRYDPKSYVLTGSVNRQPQQQQQQPRAVPENANFLTQFLFGSQLIFKADYAHKVVDKEAVGGNSIWLAADYMVNPDPAGFLDEHSWKPMSSGSIGYMIHLSSQGILQSSIKGKLRSTGEVSATVEEKLNQAVTLVMSASLDHSSADYKFGFGVSVGQ